MKPNKIKREKYVNMSLFLYRNMLPEAEKPGRRVGIADRKVFARIYIFDPKIKSTGRCGSFPAVWKVSAQSWKFLDSLESFRTVWKVFGQSGKFPDNSESFQTVWKIFGQSGKFSASLESFRTVWKLSG